MAMPIGDEFKEEETFQKGDDHNQGPVQCQEVATIDCNTILTDMEHACKVVSSISTDPPSWSSSGSSWKDFLHFFGPGWFISIAYVDPGNYQADIQAGASTGYQLLWTVLWSTILSIFIQYMCCRLAYYGQVTLAEAQAQNTPYQWLRYLNWMIAEFSVMITDLPEVIGMGIAGNILFGWSYWIGVVLSLVTTMIFLLTMNWGMRKLEIIIAFFVCIMSVALLFEMGAVGVNAKALVKGWSIDFIYTSSQDLFAVTGVLGAVVMPHNLYLHTAACQSRRVQRDMDTIHQAIRISSYEPVLPLLISFIVNMAIISIAAERVFGQPNAGQVGITDFCDFFRSFPGGCILWGIALTAAAQSSAITATFTGQYVMDGYLNIRLAVWQRALMTRLVAIVPCVIVSVLFSGPALSPMVNVVNSSLSILLPFALTPLVRFNCHRAYMGEFAAGGAERFFMYFVALAVYVINAISLSAPGAGFFDFIYGLEPGWSKSAWLILMVLVQIFYASWNIYTVVSPVQPMRNLKEERPYIPGEFSNVKTIFKSA